MSKYAVPFDANNHTLADQIMGPVFRDATFIPRLTVIGPYIIPLPINSLLLAVLTVQFGRYFSSAQQAGDRLYTRAFVMLLATCTLLTSVSLWVWTFDAFVYRYGRPSAIFRSDRVLPLFGSLVVQAFSVHTWYAMKAYHLYGRKIWPAAIIIFFAFGSAVVSVIDMYALGSEGSVIVSGLKALTKVASLLTIYLAIAADLSATALILYKLAKSRTGWSHTDTLIKRIAKMTYETQAPPTAFSAAIAIYRSVTDGSVLAMPYVMLVGSVYTFGVLWVLNSHGTLLNKSRGKVQVSAYSSTRSQGSTVEAQNARRELGWWRHVHAPDVSEHGHRCVCI